MGIDSSRIFPKNPHMRRTSHHHHSNYQHLGKFMSYSSSNTRNPVSEQSKFHILHLETIRLCVWCLYRKGRKGGWGLINGQVSNSHVDRLIHLTTHSPADLLSTPISPFFLFFFFSGNSKLVAAKCTFAV